jgi:hypothetical protein
MSAPLHAAAPEHLPAFIASPGETDVLMSVMAVVLVLAILGIGLLFLRLHTLPERMAHKSKKIQFEIVAVLGLLALLTHVHLFWVIGLLLAIIDIPDFGGALGRMASSLEKIAGIAPGEEVSEVLHEASANPAPVAETRPPLPPKAKVTVVSPRS